MEILSPLRSKLELGIRRKPKYGPLCLDIASQNVYVTGSDEGERLSVNEFQILWLLVRSRGAVIGEGEFIDFLYGDDPNQDIPLNRSLVVYISRVKRKIERLTNGRITIENVVRLGWFLENTSVIGKAALEMTFEDYEQASGVSGVSAPEPLKNNPGKTLAETMTPEELQDYMLKDVEGMRTLHTLALQGDERGLRFFRSMWDHLIGNFAYLRKLGRLPPQLENFEPEKEFAFPKD